MPFRKEQVTQSEEKNRKLPLTDVESFVENTHENQSEQMRIINLAVEIGAHFIYALLILLIAYGYRSPDAHLLGKNVNDMMIHKKFDQVNLV